MRFGLQGKITRSPSRALFRDFGQRCPCNGRNDGDLFQVSEGGVVGYQSGKLIVSECQPADLMP